MNQVLVWKHKHGEYYYDASTPEKLEKSARKIIKSLLEDMQYIYEPDDEPSKWELEQLDMELVNMDDEALAALPEVFQTKVKKQKAKHAAIYKNVEDEKKHYQIAKDFADGKVWEVPFRRQARYSEEDWQRILDKWPERTIRDGVMYRDSSAWAFLQERNGYEYENFSLEDVEGADD